MHTQHKVKMHFMREAAFFQFFSFSLCVN